MAKRYNAASVLAMEFSWSLSDLREHLYQNGRTTGPVYSIGDDYYCCVKLGAKPHQPSDKNEPKWEWLGVYSPFASGLGYQIHKAKG